MLLVRAVGLLNLVEESKYFVPWLASDNKKKIPPGERIVFNLLGIV